ncbi:MAG: hypothetical protein JSR85_07595 [Proteobacteria bacterium]|nr:hypothetical protein [Pseudomonadota bacterium]
MNPKSSTYNERKQGFPFLQNKISLKLEDKILIGIAGFFLIFIIAFAIFANTIFKSFETHKKSPVQEALTQREKTANDMNKVFEDPFRTFEEGFHHLGEVFEEDARRGHESFQKAIDNFHERFEKSKKNFKHEAL